MKKVVLVVLIILNSMMLLGQLWPAGAPPFASTVNIITLVLNLVFFIVLFAGYLKKNN